ncbi:MULTISPECIES: hypothetical protein [unclassified Bradyrhizobium]|uniref:hypothetical protein n=1 Tax=unclassified Bradyrhizobium TaxID=2631580 RepID=UPI001FFB80CC|nr:MULTISPECIES: hypothetical protein [unclassified Bradyrhizobium]MCK1311607.1 hypothetical protein [Bradyrhizobium sp. 45]MCK1436843.1 hypothetical protein [Bradyrhizobium sp. 15]MCK1611260.1 hypothetical protein [Bradyrhizobium sp. 163]MCK1761375.1 hypothetical protein [Bradyrhizobium sp. 136]
MSKKGPACSVCSHPEKWRIELLRAGGASLDSLAEKFKPLSRDAIHRHWTRHVTDDAKAGYLAGPSQMEALGAKAASEGESVLDYFRITRTALMSSLAACSEAGDARGVALVSNSLVGVLERLGKLTGEIAALAGNTINVTNVTNIINSPIFARLQAAQLRALAAFPEARAATVAAWRELDAGAADVGRAPMVIDATPLRLPCPVPSPEPTP